MLALGRSRRTLLTPPGVLLLVALTLALAPAPVTSPAQGASQSGAAVSKGRGESTTAQKARRARAARRSPRFTLGVIPDTQEEVRSAGDNRLSERTQWLVHHRKQLNLRFVVHTGDLVNWGWLAPGQYAMATTAMARLERKNIPYSISVGNHDTRRSGWDGVGGYGPLEYAQNPECQQRLGASACKSLLLVRHTEEFNAAFDAQDFGAVKGTFEPGKLDNSYSTFRAGRLRWMVLSLELWPRPEAVEWARQVVAAHPRANVIVSTHSYLADDGSIYQGADYGTTTPQYLYDHLISLYPNIKLVFSGHTGIAASRVDTGVNGNTIASFLGTFHSKTTDPVRLLKVNTRRDTVTTRFYAPATGETFPQYDAKVRGLDFVR